VLKVILLDIVKLAAVIAPETAILAADNECENEALPETVKEATVKAPKVPIFTFKVPLTVESPDTDMFPDRSALTAVIAPVRVKLAAVIAPVRVKLAAVIAPEIAILAADNECENEALPETVKEATVKAPKVPIFTFKVPLTVESPDTDMFPDRSALTAVIAPVRVKLAAVIAPVAPFNTTVGVAVTIPKLILGTDMSIKGSLKDAIFTVVLTRSSI
jgi:fumarate reductase subunit D